MSSGYAVNNIQERRTQRGQARAEKTEKVKSKKTGVALPVSFNRSFALLGFFQGVVRSAFSVAQLQLGNVPLAERVVMDVMRTFVLQAEKYPLAGWPDRFWRILAETLTRLDTPPVSSEGPLSHLTVINAEDRLALLLRIVAGLDESRAARAIGHPVDRYQHCLSRACPRVSDGRPDPDAWRALAVACQLHARAHEQEHLQQICRQAIDCGGSETRHPGRYRVLGLFFALASVIALVMFALIMWYHRPLSHQSQRTQFHPPLRHESIPTAAVVVEALPKMIVPVESALVAQPSNMLGDSTLLDTEHWLALHADFLAWSLSALPKPTSTPSLTGLSEPLCQNDRLRKTLQETMQMSDNARRARKDIEERFRAWQDAAPIERMEMARSAAVIKTLSAAQRQLICRRFAAMDRTEQEGWWLGPRVGLYYSKLQPLIGFVPENERAALIQSLRILTPSQLQKLSVIAQRTSADDRDTVREQWIKLSPGDRSRWLEDQLAR